MDHPVSVLCSAATAATDFGRGNILDVEGDYDSMIVMRVGKPKRRRRRRI